MKARLVLLGVAFFLSGVFGSTARAFVSYYDVADTSKAQAEARQRNLPIAYLGCFPESLTNGSPDANSIDELTQMALDTLQGEAVVVVFNGRNMAPVPGLIHAQFHIHDDASIKDGADWIPPKIVFCDPAIVRILGRVSYTQMKLDRDIPIRSAIQVIKNNPNALAAPPPNITPVQVVSSNVAVASWMNDYTLDAAIGVLVLIALGLFWKASQRQ